MPRRMPPAILLCLILSGFALSGCATPPPARNLDKISYSERPPIRLDVREIEIQRAYQPPNAAPNVDHLFPVPPAFGAQLWAADRLTVAGPLRRARFIVRDAPVIEIPLARSGGLTGTFTVEQSERYEARLVAELQILAEDGSIEASVTVEVTHQRTVAENLTLNERVQVWHEMTQALLDAMDQRLDAAIKEALYAYLVL
ncbi:MAG: hypothetical protein ACTSQ7_14290 [Alphaproteobacteria bacterium]